MAKSFKYKDNMYLDTKGIVHNKQILADILHPIGSVYISVTNVDPSTLFGGTWEKIGTNRVLMGSDSDANLGKTVDSGLPNITGSIDPRWVDSSGGGVMMYIQNNKALYTSRPSDHGYWWASVTATGGAGQNLQYHTRINFDASKSNSIYGKSSIVQPPAVKVYFWKRTA